MKLVAFILVCLPSLLFAQFPTVPIDFESTSINYTFYDFGGLVANGPVSNPDISAGNLSPNVLQLDKTMNANTWGGVAIPLDMPIDFSNGNILQLKIYSPRSNVPVLLKIEDTTSPPNGNGDPSIFAALTINTIENNEWEFLNFDMTLDSSFDPMNSYDQIVLFPDFGLTGMAEYFHIDDIDFYTVIEETCADTIDVISYNHMVDSTIQVEHVLTSNGVIDGSSNVFYFAGSTICLEADFTVNSGSQFVADIDGCCDEITWYEDADGDGFGNPYETIVDCVQPTGYVATPRFNIGYTTPTSYPGYSLVWSDEFDNNALDLSTWTYVLGDGCPNVCGWGNNEVIWYQEQNATVADDFLTIEAKEEMVNGYDHTSARIKTQGAQNFQYGRVDIRAKLPYSQGIWPALWMLGENITTVSWPACGEIDIMELIGGASNDNVTYGTGHWDFNGHSSAGGSYSLNNAIFADQFHVFSVIWDTTQIRWFVDDTQYFALDITDPTMSEFHNPFFFIFNVSVGGDWPGNPDATSVFPQTMEVDYIRVFQ